MTTHLNPETARDLKRRAEHCNGLEAQVADLMKEVKELKEQIKDEEKNAASQGYDKKAFKKVRKELAMKPDQRQTQLEFEMVVDTYRLAVGLLDSDSEPAGKPDKPKFEAIDGGLAAHG